MSRKWIAGLVALVAVGGTAIGVASAVGTEAETAPRPTTLTVDLSGERSNARAKGGPGGSTAKPKVVYLASSTPTTINTADPAEGGVGPYIDLALTGCSKVIDGGVKPRNLDVYVQGSYPESKSKYHVLIGLDDTAAGTTPRPTIQVDTYLTCLKGVK